MIYNADKKIYCCICCLQIITKLEIRLNLVFESSFNPGTLIRTVLKTLSVYAWLRSLQQIDPFQWNTQVYATKSGNFHISVVAVQIINGLSCFINYSNYIFDSQIRADGWVWEAQWKHAHSTRSYDRSFNNVGNI